MRFFMIPLMLVSLVLGGCAGFDTSIFAGGKSVTASVQNPVTREQQAAVEAAYGVAASGVLAYARLRRCLPGEAESVTNICSRWSAVQTLKSANRIAYSSLVQLRRFMDANQTISAISAYNAALAALRDFKAIASVNGIKT